jgi:hypothetical protein
LAFVDVTDPANPVWIGSLGLQSSPEWVTVEDELAYAVGFGGFEIVDFSDPQNPLELGFIPDVTIGPGADDFTPNFIPGDVALSGRFALLTDELIGARIPIADVADPLDPLYIGDIDFPLDMFQSYGIALTPELAFVTAEVPAITTINGALGNTKLAIGQYLAYQDMDAIAPVVDVTAPLSGATVIEGQRLQVHGEASDDVAVALVEFLVNGLPASADSTFPYDATPSVPLGASSVSLDATAYDYGGNSAPAQTVVLNVIPDPLTTAEGLVVDELGAPLVGAEATCLDSSDTTAADGSFSVAGLATIDGLIVCRVQFTTVGGKLLYGLSTSLAPVGGPLPSRRHAPRRLLGTFYGWCCPVVASLGREPASMIPGMWSVSAWRSPRTGPSALEETSRARSGARLHWARCIKSARVPLMALGLGRGGSPPELTS